MDDEFYTVEELAKLFKVGKATIRVWLNNKRFPNAFKTSDSEKAQWRIPRSDVKAFAQKEYGS